jgi:hypothetical protein
MCVCVCACVCMSVCIINTYIYTHIHIHIRVYKCIIAYSKSIAKRSIGSWHENSVLGGGVEEECMGPCKRLCVCVCVCVYMF